MVFVTDQKSLFEKTLWKIIDKAFMRNAMLALQLCDAFLQNSGQLEPEIVTQLSKKVAKNLTSSNETTRIKTVNSIASCPATKEFCEYLQLVVSGKEGKLTPAHKAQVLEALSAVKFSEGGCLAFLDAIVKFLNTETQEANIEQAKEVAMNWCAQFYTKISIEQRQGK